MGILFHQLIEIAMYCKPLEELPENKYECKLYRIEQARVIIAGEGLGLELRVYVQGGGCSGFSIRFYFRYPKKRIGYLKRMALNC